MNRESKVEKMVKDLINEMFRIAGHNVTYEDIKDRKDNWFQQYTMTLAQNDEFTKYGINYIKTNLPHIKYRAEKEMSWFNMMWGLKIKDL